MQKVKQDIKEILVAIVLFFKQSAKFISEKYQSTLGGNLDPFYLVGIFYLFKNIKNKEKIKKYLTYVIPLFLYALFQIVVLKELSILKLVVNVIKIAICIAVMLYVKDNFQKINFLKIAKYFTWINLFFTLVAITIGKSSFLWRLNDVINGYSKTRLRLFYLEPSELGFHISIIIIVLLGFLLISKTMKDRKVVLFYIAANVLTLYFAKPMGAICVLIAAVIAMLAFEFFYKPTKKKAIVYVIGFVIFIIICILLVVIENPIAMRVIDTLTGQDSSNNYRVGVSFEIFRRSLSEYSLVGCGFGNINTEAFISRYADLNLVTVVVNSFIYFWIETGLFGIVYLGILLTMLLKACIKSKSLLKWGLFVFLVIYQFTGSHFPSPINWALYGLILSDFHELSYIKNKNMLEK